MFVGFNTALIHFSFIIQGCSNTFSYSCSKWGFCCWFVFHLNCFLLWSQKQVLPNKPWWIITSVLMLNIICLHFVPFFVSPSIVLPYEQVISLNLIWFTKLKSKYQPVCIIFEKPLVLPPPCHLALQSNIDSSSSKDPNSFINCLDAI